MNESLFEKYKRVIVKKKNERQEVLTILKETIGIDFKEEEINVQKKLISFHISSAKKTILLQKNIKNKLEEKGYQIKL